MSTLAKQKGATEIFVGLPKHLSGAEGKSAHAARRFAALLAKRLPHVRVCMVDERLSTKQAQERLLAAGVSSRENRNVIDQVAAQIILEQAIGAQEASGALVGEVIQPGGTGAGEGSATRE